MLKNINKIYIVFISILITSIYIMARPPRPNPDFVWIPKHRIQMGVIIPGHWEYRGKKIDKKRKIYRGYKKRHDRVYRDRIGGFR